MKNFYDLLVTDCRTVTLRLHIIPVIEGGAPDTTITVNDNIQWSGALSRHLSLVIDVPLMSHIDLGMTLANKVYNKDRDTALLVQHLSVDNHDMIPRLDHCVTYQNDHDFSHATNYLGFNGTWRLQINQPFYHWLHQELGHGWLLKPNA